MNGIAKNWTTLKDSDVNAVICCWSGLLVAMTTLLHEMFGHAWSRQQKGFLRHALADNPAQLSPYKLAYERGFFFEWRVLGGMIEYKHTGKGWFAPPPPTVFITDGVQEYTVDRN